jgi:pimeloyl-ACP methyl ester carboxylesterase
LVLACRVEGVADVTGELAPSDAPELYYEDKGSGRSILLIHPAGATASTWGQLADELAQVARVIAYDRRGYRRSGGSPPRSIAEHTADAAALVEALHIGPVVAVGTSVGATIAIDLARLRPDLVHAVVAHESPWRVTHHRPTLRQIRALSTMSLLAARGRHPEAAAAFLRFAYTYGDGGSAWDRFPDEWRRAVNENAQAALIDIRIAIGGYPSARQLAAVERPVVCSCGERSAKTMRRVTRGLHPDSGRRPRRTVRRAQQLRDSRPGRPRSLNRACRAGREDLPGAGKDTASIVLDT